MTDAILIALLSACVSLMSLAVSMTTMYFAWLRRGRLAMTKPVVVYFGFDKVPRQTAKIFLRTLLYSTSAKGKVVEAMYAKLRTGSIEQTFSFWGHGETEKLSPGSGMLVSQSGVVANHHFVVSVHKPEFEFVAAVYTAEVFARLAGERAPRKLSTFVVPVDEQHAAGLKRGAGVLFELLPDEDGYAGHLDHSRGGL
jgi:hypothetical protein